MIPLDSVRYGTRRIVPVPRSRTYASRIQLRGGLSVLNCNFHITGDSSPTEVGFESIAAAKRSAMRFVADLIFEEDALSFWDRDWAVTVTDDNDLTLFQISVVATDAPVIQAMARPAS